MNNGAEDIRLVPVSASTFVYDDDSGRALEFISDADGTISAIKLVRPDGIFTLNKAK